MGLCSCCSWACLRKWVEFYVLLFQASSPSLITPGRSSVHLFSSPVQFWLFAEGESELFSCFNNFHALDPIEYQKCWNLEERSLGKAAYGVYLKRSDRGVMGRSWCLFPDTQVSWETAQSWGRRFLGDVGVICTEVWKFVCKNIFTMLRAVD